MRLTEALHFYFGDLTNSHRRVQYSHFQPSAEDYALRAKIHREMKAKKNQKPVLVMEDLFE